MQLPAARKGDKTLHGGEVTEGFARVLIGGKPAARVDDMHSCPLPAHQAGPVEVGSPTVLIGGYPAARKFDTAICVGPAPFRPDALTESDILASATGFTKGTAHDTKRLFALDKDKRRAWLKEMALEDYKAGKSSLEIFSNTVQRSQWAVLPFYRKADMGSDVGLLFSDYETPLDKSLDVLLGTANEKYNVNKASWIQDGKETSIRNGNGLPFTGFSERYRNDDDNDPEGDQTHHLAFFAMVGSTRLPNIVGEFFGWASDLKSPQDQELAYVGIELGSKFGDPDIDINAWIWDHVGGGPDAIHDGCSSVLIGTSG